MPRKKISLAQTHPDVAEQAWGWDPKTVSPSSGEKLPWKCSEGHLFEARPTHRIRSKSKSKGCPFCSGIRVVAGKNDLATMYPRVAEEALGWDPTLVSPHSSERKKWKCKRGHSWQTSVNNRTGRRSGCPYCKNSRIVIGENDLLTTHRRIAEEADGWDPKTVTYGSSRVVSWKCKRGHSWKSSINARTKPDAKHSGQCPYCENVKIWPGYNDLATLFTEIAAEAFEWSPDGIDPKEAKKRNWRCQWGHIFSASSSDRVGGLNCHFCAGRKVWPGFNDLATTHPEIARQALGWDPTSIGLGHKGRKKFTCELGHIWITRVNARKLNGCPACAKSGYNPSLDGWLYFLEHSEWNLLQIGITNFPKKRLATHNKLGWSLIELRGPMDGLLAREWEATILRYIKASGGKFADKIDIEPFDGYSESWLRSSFSFETFHQITQIIDEIENGK